MFPPIATLPGTFLPGSPDASFVVSPPTKPGEANSAPPAPARFEVLRTHASGGLGRVSVALDNELHRHVAVKEIHPQLADHPESRARFLLEAEVTGSLEHPGVVPVYSLGTWSDGRPYYAMRLIRGQSLEEAVGQFHAGSRDAGERELRLRKLLRRFIDICNAVDYAHSRGVLHRDLKPANVMLGPYGETLVVDWGLAKPAAGRDEPAPSGESWLAPTASGNTPATRAGSVMGTPAYMSPEQASGGLDRLGPASDVYSLGATLYTILTNRPPFAEESLGLMRARVMRGDFPRPRSVCCDVHRPLEAICLKAMALRPSDRYASARALAEDIEHWLGDAPVTAYREGRIERWSRWSRRHRAWARAGALSLVLVTAVSVAAACLVNEARLQTTKAHQERALAQVELLCNAQAAAIPPILANLRPFHDEVAPRLSELLAAGKLTPRQRMRLDLALVENDPTRVADLVDAMLTCPFDDFDVVRDRLRPFAETIVDRLWETLHNPRRDPDGRFRAGLALAAYAPDAAPWTADDDAFMARSLLGQSVDHQRQLRSDLRPIAGRLLPEVDRLLSDESQPSDVLAAATAALAAWGGDRPKLLAAAVSKANAEQFALLLPALAEVRDRAAVVAALREIVCRQPADDEMREQERIALGRLRAGAACALLRLDEKPAIVELFTPADDREAQTQFVAGLRAREVDPERLIAQLARPRQEAMRFGLLLALGEFRFEEIPEPARDRVTQWVTDWYRSEPSSAIHSACSWLLTIWQLRERVDRIDQRPHMADPDPRREWYNVQVGEPGEPGMLVKMLVFPAGEFLMGSPATETDRQEQETQHRVRLSRPFAMSHRSISRGIYARFLRQTRGQAAADAWLAAVREQAPTDLHPAVHINWYDAVLFTRWLTLEAGMRESDQCYADPSTLKLGNDGYPLDRQWPFHPERKGFRLPTEAEWEYACRAGTVTAFSFGSDQSLAGDYGWTQSNSAGVLQQSCSLKPTGRGLVSMHGNVGEWCHDWLGFIPGGAGVDPTGAAEGPCRAVRGGSFLSVAALSRSAARAGLPPEFAPPYIGVRLVCTISQH